MKDCLRKIDKPLLIATVIMTIFGLIMIFSSSSISAVLQYKQTEYYFFKHQVIVVVGAIFASLLIICIPTSKYRYISRLIILLIIFSLFALKTYGTVTNSARSWIRVFGYSLQPSEFAKTAIILYLATYYGFKKRFNTIYDIFIPLIPCVVIFGLVASEPDLGTAAIIGVICMFIFFTLPIKKNNFIKALKLIAILGIGGAIIFLNGNTKLLTGSQASRFNFKNPCERYLDETGYQVCNGYIAINNGGIFGLGLGNSTQKYLYLPEAHTDFIFPIIVEEFGLIGGGAVFILYLFILFRILVISRNAHTLCGSIIALGTFAYIITHIFVNVGGLLALIPLTGVPLPFLSYGGSFILNLLILIALTQRVAIENKIKTKQVM